MYQENGLQVRVQRFLEIKRQFLRDRALTYMTDALLKIAGFLHLGQLTPLWRQETKAAEGKTAASISCPDMQPGSKEHLRESWDHQEETAAGRY